MSEITVEVLSSDKEKATKIALPESVFGCDVNIPLIHQVVVAQLAAARQGTHATKTRGQVSGGGAKPWRQKGTGRARHGSRRAPQWAGGGVVHGPQPRSYAQRTPKKMIAAALRSALSERVADSKFFVMEAIVSSQPSTREALDSLSVVGDYRSAVVVLHRDEDIAWLSLRNVPNVHALAVDQLNVYDIISNEVIVFTRQALDEFIARLGMDELVEQEAPAASPAEAKKPKKTKTVEASTPLEVDDADEPVVDDADEVVAEEEATVEEEAAVEDEAVVEATEDSTSQEAEPAQADDDQASQEDKDYGEGSYRGPNPPEDFEIKGKEGSMLYYTPSSRGYKRTIADVWFASAEAAGEAGFTDAQEGKK